MTARRRSSPRAPHVRQDEGWSLSYTTKAHYFRDGISLCRRVVLDNRPIQLVAGNLVARCTQCVTALEQLARLGVVAMPDDCRRGQP